MPWFDPGSKDLERSGIAIRLESPDKLGTLGTFEARFTDTLKVDGTQIYPQPALLRGRGGPADASIFFPVSG